MRRVLAYFKWNASRWKSLAEDPPVIEAEDQGKLLSEAIQQLVDKEHRLLIAGKWAYALRQAGIWDKLKEHCELKWVG